MSFLEKIKNMFLNKKEDEKILEIYAPISGEFVNLEEVPDKTFSQKMLGEGLAINPTQNGEILSPVDGTLVQLFRTGHAFTVQTDDEVNILVHFGMNTVELEGKGFTKILEEGAKVKKGDPIIKYDYNFLKENATSVITPIVILDSEELTNIEVIKNEKIKAGETLILKIKK